MSRFISLPTIPEPSNKPRSSTEERGSRDSAIPTFQELVARESLKKVSQWFETWREWQRRVFICQALERSSTHQLRVLATVLEPVLHIGFSSSLVPHLASLHVDGAATFQIQRGVLQRVLVGDSESILDRGNSVAHLPSLPTTLASSETVSSGEIGRERAENSGTRGERVALHPALPLTHTQHHQQPHSLSPESSLEDVLSLRHTRFSSVPDFQSTTNLLRDVRRKDLLRPRHTHKRSRSLGSYQLSYTRISRRKKQQETERFKNQLATVSEVIFTSIDTLFKATLCVLCSGCRLGQQSRSLGCCWS